MYVLWRQHTKAPLAAALSPFVSLLYPPNPWCEWCDVWRLTTTPGSTSPTLFEQWCGFFYVPQEPDKCKCCEMGPTVFRPYQRRLGSLTVCRCHYKGSTFFYFEPVTSRSADWRSPNREPTRRRNMELHNVLFYLYSIIHDIGYNFFLFFLNTLLNYSQSRLGALNDRVFPNTVFWAALKATYLYGILS